MTDLYHMPGTADITSKAKSLGNGSASKAFYGRGDKTAAMPPIRHATLRLLSSLQANLLAPPMAAQFQTVTSPNAKKVA
ncbi:MAG: hypothetical protein IJY22_03815 [Clostridia bacterium]|nr:hypothetical protein [Clostridia bacterium]